MRIITKDYCAGCETLTVVSDASEQGIVFYEPVCQSCRAEAIKESQMDSFDVAYERARTRGWAD